MKNKSHQFKRKWRGLQIWTLKTKTEKEFSLHKNTVNHLNSGSILKTGSQQHLNFISFWVKCVKLTKIINSRRGNWNCAGKCLPASISRQVFAPSKQTQQTNISTNKIEAFHWIDVTCSFLVYYTLFRQLPCKLFPMVKCSRHWRINTT